MNIWKENLFLSFDIRYESYDFSIFIEKKSSMEEIILVQSEQMDRPKLSLSLSVFSGRKSLLIFFHTVRYVTVRYGRFVLKIVIQCTIFYVGTVSRYQNVYESVTCSFVTIGEYFMVSFCTHDTILLVSLATLVPKVVNNWT